MSRIIKIHVSDKDYRMIKETHKDVVGDILNYLGCTERPETDDEYIIRKILSYPTGTVFNYREVFDNRSECLTVVNAKAVRRLCKSEGLAKPHGYNNEKQIKEYIRV